MQVDKKITDTIGAAHFLTSYLESAVDNPSLNTVSKTFAKRLLEELYRLYPVMDVLAEEDVYYYPNTVINNISH